MKDFQIILADINETMCTSIDGGIPTIKIGRFHEAIKHKQRILCKPKAMLEEHIADCFSHEIVHIIVYEQAEGSEMIRYNVSGGIDCFPFNCPFSAECRIFDPSGPSKRILGFLR